MFRIFLTKFSAFSASICTFKRLLTSYQRQSACVSTERLLDPWPLKVFAHFLMLCSIRFLTWSWLPCPLGWPPLWLLWGWKNEQRRWEKGAASCSKLFPFHGRLSYRLFYMICRKILLKAFQNLTEIGIPYQSLYILSSFLRSYEVWKF